CSRPASASTRSRTCSSASTTCSSTPPPSSEETRPTMKTFPRGAGLAALLPLLLAPATAHAIGATAPGAAGPGTLKAPSGPGSVLGLPSDATVRLFSADLAYSVPFELPSALHGFAPRLE